ncbi:MAG: hypothetical protein ACTH27_02480 [Staphylococcus equorum]
MTIENGVIINNADLYQMIDVQDLLELDIPLPLFIADCKIKLDT